MTYQHYLIADVETAGRADAERYVEAASNLKDPAKVEASKLERAGKLALDINGSRIVCLGWWASGANGPSQWICTTEDDEIVALKAFWSAWAAVPNMHRMLIGYKARTFDAMVLIRRSQLLNVKPARLSLKRYNMGDVYDLFEEICFFETQQTGVVPRTLDVMCELFKLDVPADEHSGADIAALVAEERWIDIAKHNECDLHKTRALAIRLGVIDSGVQAPTRKLAKMDIGG